MTITDPNTVFILGAGTSKPFGLSLGVELIDELKEAIDRELHKLQEASIRHKELKIEDPPTRRRVIAAHASLQGFKESPIIGTIAQQYQKENKFDWPAIDENLERLRNLSGLLTNQTSETIDDFIIENPSYRDLTKICIAANFMMSCYDFNDRNTIVKPFEERYHPKPKLKKSSDREQLRDWKNPSNRNWVHLFINIARHGIRSKKVNPDNKVCVITFNYDKILEYVLEKQFSNTERRSAHYTDYIDIVHVHGECGELLNTAEPAKVCFEWAKGIHVIHEDDIPEEVEKKRERAKRLMRSAKEIYFCGFAFSGPNCRLLELGNPRSDVKERTISYCNFDGNVGITKTVEKFENQLAEISHIPRLGIQYGGEVVLTYIDEEAGTVDKPLGVTDWLRMGNLGELPG